MQLAALMADISGELGGYGSFVLAVLGVGALLMTVLALWVDARIGKRLQPVITRLDRLDTDSQRNGGVHSGIGGRVDGTSKDINATTLEELRRLAALIESREQ